MNKTPNKINKKIQKIHMGSEPHPKQTPNLLLTLTTILLTGNIYLSCSSDDSTNGCIDAPGTLYLTSEIDSTNEHCTYEVKDGVRLENGIPVTEGDNVVDFESAVAKVEKAFENLVEWEASDAIPVIIDKARNIHIIPGEESGDTIYEPAIGGKFTIKITENTSDVVMAGHLYVFATDMQSKLMSHSINN